MTEENREQEKVFMWAGFRQHQAPELRLLYAIPNGGWRSPATATLLKRTGVKPGVPDMCLPVARQGYHGLYIELKRGTGGRVSVEQKKWLLALSQEGYKACVCRGADEAIQTIRAYIGLTGANAV